MVVVIQTADMVDLMELMVAHTIPMAQGRLRAEHRQHPVGTWHLLVNPILNSNLTFKDKNNQITLLVG